MPGNEPTLTTEQAEKLRDMANSQGTDASGNAWTTTSINAVHSGTSSSEDRKKLIRLLALAFLALD